MKSRKFEKKQGASYSEFQRLVVQLGISLSYMDHNIKFAVYFMYFGFVEMIKSIMLSHLDESFGKLKSLSLAILPVICILS